MQRIEGVRNMKRTGLTIMIVLVAIVAHQRLGVTDTPKTAPSSQVIEAPKSTKSLIPRVSDDEVTRMTVTWHEFANGENCIDTFGHSCTPTNPGPSCPAGITVGASCTAYGSGYVCYQYISPGIQYNGWRCL